MRLLALAAAALITTGIAAAPADAQPGRPGWHHGGGWHGHHRWRGRRCTWVWRHHHRVRRCW